MTKQKKTAADAAGSGQRERPPHGGRFIRDPETGELECVEQTDSAGTLELTEETPAAEPESGSGQAEPSGGAAGPGPGSTVGDADQQEA